MAPGLEARGATPLVATKRSLTSKVLKLSGFDVSRIRSTWVTAIHYKLTFRYIRSTTNTSERTQAPRGATMMQNAPVRKMLILFYGLFIGYFSNVLAPSVESTSGFETTLRNKITLNNITFL